MNLNEILKTYLGEIQTAKTTNTYLTYETALEHWFPNGQVNITHTYIVDTLSKWQCSQNTKVLRCRILKGFIEYCLYFTDIQDKHPILQLLNGYKRKETIPEFVSQEQYHKILNVCTSLRLEACIQLMYENGLRSDEVLNIKSNDYDSDNKSIVIRDTKNGNDYKILITESLNQILKMVFDNSSEYLIHTRSGKRIANNNLRVEVKDLCTKAGFPELHCHSFRHGSAMYLLENNVNLFTIQKHLRHKSIQSTQKYLHYTDKQQQQVNELFSKI